jgi:hypothetical protein
MLKYWDDWGFKTRANFHATQTQQAHVIPPRPTLSQTDGPRIQPPRIRMAKVLCQRLLLLQSIAKLDQYLSVASRRLRLDSMSFNHIC